MPSGLAEVVEREPHDDDDDGRTVGMTILFDMLGR